MNESEWNAGFLCDEHGESFCPTCKPKSLSKVVYITAGGQAYHRSLDCEGLHEGQRFVAQRGGTPSDPTSVSVSAAKREGREPCLVCWPPQAAQSDGRLRPEIRTKPQRQVIRAATSKRERRPTMATSHPNDWGFDPSNWPDDDLWYEATQQLRDALEAAAAQQTTMSYADAAKAVRCIELDAVSVRLAHLLCQQIHHDASNGLPLLSSIVIGQHRNQPGKGYFTFARRYFKFRDDEVFWLAELDAVFKHYGRRARRRGAETGMTHRVALPAPQEQRPQDQAAFIASFFE